MDVLPGGKPRDRFDSHELPGEIRLALRAARVRRQARRCFRIATRVVLDQNVVPLLYVEGWVQQFGMRFPHAWVRHPTIGDVDLLIVAYEYHPLLVMTGDELDARIWAGGRGGPFTHKNLVYYQARDAAGRWSNGYRTSGGGRR